MESWYDTTGERDLVAVGIGDYGQRLQNRINCKDDVECIIQGMTQMEFTCENPLIGNVTRIDLIDHINFMIADGKQASNDMFALCISSMVALNHPIISLLYKPKYRSSQIKAPFFILVVLQ